MSKKLTKERLFRAPELPMTLCIPAATVVAIENRFYTSMDDLETKFDEEMRDLEMKFGEAGDKLRAAFHREMVETSKPGDAFFVAAEAMYRNDFCA